MTTSVLIFGHLRKRNGLRLPGCSEGRRSATRRGEDVLERFASSDGERPAEGRAAREDRGFEHSWQRPMSRPPTDGRPGRAIRAWAATSNADLLRHDSEQHERAGSASSQQRTPNKQPCVRSQRPSLYCGDLTFDMSGGPKGAQRPLERPLDGVVRCPRGARRRTRAAKCWGLATRHA